MIEARAKEGWMVDKVTVHSTFTFAAAQQKVFLE